MSKAKKLNLPLLTLIEIAKALNENTIANRSRSKDEKIGNDVFIRQKFDIARKDYIETCKGTPIRYNKYTFLYDFLETVEESLPLQSKISSVTKVLPSSTDISALVKEYPEVLSEIIKDEAHKSITEELPEPKRPVLEVKGNNTESNKKVTLIKDGPKEVSNTKELPKELKEIISISQDLKEMVDWYKKQRLNFETATIELDRSSLTGKIKSRSFKIYENVLNDFVKYCKEHGEYKQQDILSMALLDYIKRYSY